MFSSRTDWQRTPNYLAMLLEERRSVGLSVIDLTISNPTKCGISYADDRILRALTDETTLIYDPSPFGSVAARKAIAGYYAVNGISVDPAHIVLTAGTSEAYGMLFMLLCDPHDTILVPTPSYPLFEYLARLHNITPESYRLLYDGEWHLDMQSVREAMRDSVRAIVIVSPHNPTGMVVREAEMEELCRIAQHHSVPLIVDEVFLDYQWRRTQEIDTCDGILKFSLNGISKTLGLPQLKLGWIVVTGEAGSRNEALERLEIVSDTFLSVNTPVQHALPRLFELGSFTREDIQKRIEVNLRQLQSLAARSSLCSVLNSDGGWSAVLRVPRTKTDEEWAIVLLKEYGILVHPGYFFDFSEPGYLVVSLLPEPDLFQHACVNIMRGIAEHV